MFESLSTKSILTKIRVMFGKRLKAADYEQLVQMHSVAEVASYLKNSTHYGPALASIDENTVHRGYLESLLRKERFTRYMRLIRYDFSQETDFYRFVVIRGEVEELLTAVRLLRSGASLDLLFTLPAYLERYASFPIRKLATVRSYDDLLAVIRRTPYYKVLELFRPVGNEPVNILACETALETYYYHTILSLIARQFHGAPRQELESLMYQEIEFYNIALVYRLKRFFRTGNEEIRSLLLPFDTPGSGTILQMLEADTFDRLRQVLEESSYRKFLSQDGRDIYYIEGFTQKAGVSLCKHLMRFSTQPSSALVSYLYLLSTELANITNIIEGIRYGLAPKDIRVLLIL